MQAKVRPRLHRIPVFHSSAARPCCIGFATPTTQPIGDGMAVKTNSIVLGKDTAIRLVTQVDTVVFSRDWHLTPEVGGGFAE